MMMMYLSSSVPELDGDDDVFRMTQFSINLIVPAQLLKSVIFEQKSKAQHFLELRKCCKKKSFYSKFCLIEYFWY